MPIAGDSMPLPSNGHSLTDAFKKASHGAERTLQPASTKFPKITEEDRPPPSPPSLARIDESCGTCSPAPSGRNHGGHGSGHAAQDDAGKLGKRPPRAPGKAVNSPSVSLTLYRNYRISISRHETGRGIRSTPGRGNRIKQLAAPSQIHVAKARLGRTERMMAAPRAAKGRTRLRNLACPQTENGSWS